MWWFRWCMQGAYGAGQRAVWRIKELFHLSKTKELGPILITLLIFGLAGLYVLSHGQHTVLFEGKWTYTDVKDMVERRELRMRTAAPMPLEKDEPRGVALLFEIISTLETSTLWERWFEEARSWIDGEGLEKLADGQQSSKILRPFIHYFHLMEHDHIRQNLPKSMQDAAISDPAPCTWSNTNPCAHKLYERAVEEMPEAQFFVLISHNAIPLKPFSRIYSELQRDKRSRWAVVSTVFDRSFFPVPPKVSNWKLLNREDVETLLRYQKSWVDLPKFEDCGSDEFWPMIPQILEQGEKYFSRVKCGTWREKPKSQWGSDGVISADVCKEGGFTFECWYECEAYGNLKDQEPARFLDIKQSLLDKLIEDPDVFVGRKFTNDSNVTLNDGSKVSLNSYISKKLGLKSQYEWKPQSVDELPDSITFRQFETPKQMQDYFASHPARGMKKFKTT